MPAYLSDEWFAVAGDALATRRVDPPVDPPLVIAQTVTDAPAGTVRYQIIAEGDAASLVLARGTELSFERPADVSFTMTFETASQIAQGALSAQWAFMRGRLQVGGDITRMIASVHVVESLAEAFAPVIAATTFG